MKIKLKCLRKCELGAAMGMPSYVIREGQILDAELSWQGVRFKMPGTDYPTMTFHFDFEKVEELFEPAYGDVYLVTEEKSPQYGGEIIHGIYAKKEDAAEEVEAATSLRRRMERVIVQ